MKQIKCGQNVCRLKTSCDFQLTRKTLVRTKCRGAFINNKASLIMALLARNNLRHYKIVKGTRGAPINM